MNSVITVLRVWGFSLCLVTGVQTVSLGKQAAQSSPGGSSSSQQQAPPKIDDSLFSVGSRLSSQKADNLESRLSTDPQDLAARVTLIGYYFSKNWSDRSIAQKMRGHILWLIQNHPDSQLHRNPTTRLYLDKEGFEQAKQLWLKQVEAYKGNTSVLSNAIDFVLIQDKALAEKLLKQGAAAEPNEPQWHRRLGELYHLQLSNASGEVRRSLAAISYEQYEQALRLTSDDRKFYLLVDLAKAAFATGEVTQARTWSAELLNQAAARPKDWNYGNAIHHGHIILGRIALLSGNMVEATQQLIEAGKTPGSAQLDSFGPNMILAKELLERGEREAVLQYFQLCGNFWKNHKLEEWTTSVKAGGIPDFGANLVY